MSLVSTQSSSRWARCPMPSGCNRQTQTHEKQYSFTDAICDSHAKEATIQLWQKRKHQLGEPDRLSSQQLSYTTLPPARLQGYIPDELFQSKPARHELNTLLNAYTFAAKHIILGTLQVLGTGEPKLTSSTISLQPTSSFRNCFSCEILLHRNKFRKSAPNHRNFDRGPTHRKVAKLDSWST